MACCSSSGRETLLTGRPLINLKRRKGNSITHFIEGETHPHARTHTHLFGILKIVLYSVYKGYSSDKTVKIQLTLLHWSLGGRNVEPPEETRAHVAPE